MAIMDPMADSPIHLSYIIILVLELNAGMLMNLFLIYAIYCDFMKTKTLSSSYKILLCLGVSNVCYSALTLFGLLDSFCSLGILSMAHSIYIYIYLMLVTISLCSTFTASLGLFYCIKICNFDSGFLSRVKKNITSVVPRMLLVDVLTSLFNSVLSSFLFLFSPALPHNTTDSSLSFLSTFSKSSTTLINSAILNSVGPFLVILITTLYSVVSLMKHRQRMKKSLQMPNSECLRSYDKVVCRMTQSLLFYGIFYTVIVILYYTVIIRMEFGVWSSFPILSLFPTVQATLLVLANPKLKAAWKDMFLCVHLREMLKFV